LRIYSRWELSQSLANIISLWTFKTTTLLYYSSSYADWWCACHDEWWMMALLEINKKSIIFTEEEILRVDSKVDDWYQESSSKSVSKIRELIGRCMCGSYTPSYCINTTRYIHPSRRLLAHPEWWCAFTMTYTFSLSTNTNGILKFLNTFKTRYPDVAVVIY
jgi:hypothetical protein